MAETLTAVAPLVAPDGLVISVAAGVRLATLAKAFGDGPALVRVMPNTPAQIGKGMSVAVAAGSLRPERHRAVEALLDAVGESAWVEDEALIDAVTALSGSGPAYVFLLAECLAKAGEAAGLPPDLAAQLARQTVIGGGALLEASPDSAAKLRENVTSPKGTTAAALAVLMAPDGLAPLLAKAVEAARKRSVELG
jgi:pyrroline-5-carboxylate reductase